MESFFLVNLLLELSLSSHIIAIHLDLMIMSSLVAKAKLVQNKRFLQVSRGVCDYDVMNRWVVFSVCWVVRRVRRCMHHKLFSLLEFKEAFTDCIVCDYCCWFLYFSGLYLFICFVVMFVF